MLIVVGHKPRARRASAYREEVEPEGEQAGRVGVVLALQPAHVLVGLAAVVDSIKCKQVPPPASEF